MFSILKIPFILATTLALHVAATPPNPPPPESERATKVDTTMSHRFTGLAAVQHVFSVMKVCWWLAAASEIAIIIAHRVPAASSLLSIMPDAFLIRNDSTGVELTLQSTIGMVFIITAGLLRLQCYRTLGRFFTFEVSIRKGHQLVTTGPYNIVRHPSYSGSLLMCIGMILWFTSHGGWVRESGVLGTVPGSIVAFGFVALALCISVSIWQRVPLEDELLRNLFKQEWEHWARRVPYVLIPWVY